METTLRTQKEIIIQGRVVTILRRLWRARVSYLLLLPFLVPFLVFVVYPIAWSAQLSTTEYAGVASVPPKPVDFDNYKELLSIQIREVTRLTDEETGEPLSECTVRVPDSQRDAVEETGADCKRVPRIKDELTGETLYDCSNDAVPDSQVAALKAEGQTCEARYKRPSQLLSDGFGEYDEFSFRGKTYLVGARDSRFIRALYNTFRYAIAAVFLSTMLGLLLALALQKQSRLNFLLRTLFFLPSVTSTVAIAVIWRWLLSSEDFGFINGILETLGREEPIVFLADTSWTLPVLIMMAVWGGMGYNMILFLAGLQSIPAELYEAAAVDGATTRQRFRHITLPMLRPTMLFVVVTGSITAFQVFESVYIVFTSVERIGGVLDSGLTVVPYLYDQGFTQFHLGYAAAIAWILFSIIFMLTMINLWIGRRFEAV